MKQDNFFSRHEFGLLFITVTLLFYATLYVFNHPDLLWALTNPIVKLMGGQP